jgi:hypothetical protein
MVFLSVLCGCTIFKLLLLSCRPFGPLVPSKNKRAANRRVSQNKTPMEVRIASVIKPYKSDPIINFSIRYQASLASFTTRNITRGMLLNTMFAGAVNATHLCTRLFSAVRVNQVTLTTSIQASIQWLSQYAPTSTTTITGTSTTAAGTYTSRPPKNSLASFWSTSQSDESEVLFQVVSTLNDYIDVSFSAVFMDSETPISITISGFPAVSQVYRSPLDGPAAVSPNWLPVGLVSLN